MIRTDVAMAWVFLFLRRIIQNTAWKLQVWDKFHQKAGPWKSGNLLQNPQSVSGNWWHPPFLSFEKDCTNIWSCKNLPRKELFNFQKFISNFSCCKSSAWLLEGSLWLSRDSCTFLWWECTVKSYLGLKVYCFEFIDPLFSVFCLKNQTWFS